ncbi:hypothetical protein K438DRAFT_2016085 [Mycena galopus ATCC 62051]|nr:hypothetical protein K438DRAFT_2016085 [Mycena galopus ATCC 62051]
MSTTQPQPAYPYAPPPPQSTRKHRRSPYDRPSPPPQNSGSPSPALDCSGGVATPPVGTQQRNSPPPPQHPHPQQHHYPAPSPYDMSSRRQRATRTTRPAPPRVSLQAFHTVSHPPSVYSVRASPPSVLAYPHLASPGLPALALAAGRKGLGHNARLHWGGLLGRSHKRETGTRMRSDACAAETGAGAGGFAEE